MSKMQKFMNEYANYSKEKASKMDTKSIIEMSKKLGIYDDLIKYIDFYLD